MKKEKLVKEYFSLKDLIPIVDLKYRQLLKRIKIVSVKYINDDKMIFKKSNVWHIHKSLVNEFKRKRYPIPYKWSVTLNSFSKLDHPYWTYIIRDTNKKIKTINPEARVKYVIEQTKKHVNHLHFMTTLESKTELRKLLDNNFLTNSINSMNVKITSVWEAKGLHKYYKKSDKPVLLR